MGRLEQNTKFWLLFHLAYIEFAVKTDFGQLISSQSNDTEKPLCYNYIVMGQT